MVLEVTSGITTPPLIRPEIGSRFLKNGTELQYNAFKDPTSIFGWVGEQYLNQTFRRDSQL